MSLMLLKLAISIYSVPENLITRNYLLKKKIFHTYKVHAMYIIATKLLISITSIYNYFT